MIRFWVVVGDHDTRKTAALRALTGAARTEEAWQVEYSASGNQLTYVELRGLQEQRDPYCPPSEFVRRVEAARAAYGTERAIFALRHKKLGNRPDADTYIRALRTAGWHLEHIGVTGANYSPTNSVLATNYPGQVTFIHPQLPSTPGYSVASGAKVTPPNEIARQLRQPFGLA